MGNYTKPDLLVLAMSDLTGLSGILSAVPLTTQRIHCDVIFGSPRSNCSGAGICKIVDIHSGQRVQLQRSCRRTPALLTASDTGQVLTMTFLREFLCVHLLRHHFRKDLLEVQDACVIPARLVEQLSLTGDAILPANYTIEETASGFNIHFPL